MTIETFARLGPFETNSYLLIDETTKRCAVIDPTFDTEPMLERIEALSLKVDWVLNTHGHCDHTFNNRLFVERCSAPLAMHRADLDFIEGLEDQLAMFGLPLMTSPLPNRYLEEGDTVEVGSLSLRVLCTPGHSPGSVSFVVDAGGEPPVAVVGDALFAGSIGRTDLPGGDMQTLLNAIRIKLFTLCDDTRVLAGHGPETTIGIEKRTNPFLTE